MKKSEYLKRRAKIRMKSMMDDGTYASPYVSGKICPKPTPHTWHKGTKFKGAYVCRAKLSQAQTVILGAH
jgi:hypothetical protein